MNRLRAASWTLLVSGALALLGCTPEEGGTPSATAPPTAPAEGPALRLAIDQWPGYYPAALADDLGYFTEAGVQVTLDLPGDTDRMLGAFAGGQYDLIGVALGDLITLSRNRPDVAVLLVSDESAGGDALLARAGFEVGTAPVVRIGTNLGGFGELFVRELLPRLPLPLERVEWINVDAAAVPKALQDGSIDLGHSWEPYVSAAVSEGAQRLLSSADTPGLIPDVIAASRSLAETRSAELQAFNRAWFRAVDWWLAHPQEAQARIEARLKLPAGSVSLAGIELQTAADNRRLIGTADVPGTLPATIDRYSGFFVTRGRLVAPVQATQMLLPAALP